MSVMLLRNKEILCRGMSVSGKEQQPMLREEIHILVVDTEKYIRSSCLPNNMFFKRHS